MPSRQRIIGVVALLAGLVALGWFFFLRDDRTEAAVFYGNIDIREVSLGFRGGGRVERLAVDEGASVAAGAVLGELDAGPLDQALAEAEANAHALKARVELLRAGNTREDIGQASATVQERRAAVRDAQADVDRLQSLIATGATSARELENAISARDGAAARLRAAEQALSQQQVGPRREEIAEAEANYARALAQVEAAKLDLADGVLTAPAPGVVLTRAVEPGAIVAAGAPAFTLSLSQPVWARIYVGAEQLGVVSPGALVHLTTDAAPGKIYQGRIGFVSPTAEFTPKTVETPDLRTALVYRARVVVTNPDSRLRQGMPVTVEVVSPPPSAPRAGRN